MTPAARIATAAELLDSILAGEAAEKVLTGWARRSRFAGSKDRAAIRDLVFDALRCRRGYACLGGAETGRGIMLGALIAGDIDPTTVFTGDGHAPAKLTPAEIEQTNTRPELADMPRPVACDMPDWLWPAITRSLGAETEAICAALRTRAPVFLRVNLRAASRDTVRRQLAEEDIQTHPHPNVETALEVTENARRIAQSRPYAQGLVELQDAASQATTAQLPLRDDMSVLDFCAGGGGKTLAMADRVNARFAAHDANPGRMADLPGRAARAGIRVKIENTPKPPYDLVLCDAPCSGSGAWRRAPEGKWTLTQEALDRLTSVQDQILDTAAGLVAPDGHLAYATCSILDTENDRRAEAFLSRHPEWRIVSSHQWLPGEDGDGFYLAVFRRSDPEPR